MEEDEIEFEIEPDFIPDIYLLEESKSADEFYHRLGKMILDVPKYNEEELKYLSELVSKPWKRKKGRPSNEQRDFEIKSLYYTLADHNKEPKKIKDFIQLVQIEFRMDFDAARKAVRNALGPPVKKANKEDDV